RGQPEGQLARGLVREAVDDGGQDVLEAVRLRHPASGVLDGRLQVVGLDAVELGTLEDAAVDLLQLDLVDGAVGRGGEDHRLEERRLPRRVAEMDVFRRHRVLAAAVSQAALRMSTAPGCGTQRAWAAAVGRGGRAWAPVSRWPPSRASPRRRAPIRRHPSLGKSVRRWRARPCLLSRRSPPSVSARRAESRWWRSGLRNSRRSRATSGWSPGTRRKPEPWE